MFGSNLFGGSYFGEGFAGEITQIPFIDQLTIVYDITFPLIDISFIASSTSVYTLSVFNTVDHPVLKSVSALNDKIFLQYSELLDPGSVPATTDFDVEINASPITVLSVELNGRLVILTLASAIILGDTVTISYTA